jgi:hypothetical protein
MSGSFNKIVLAFNKIVLAFISSMTGAAGGIAYAGWQYQDEHRLIHKYSDIGYARKEDQDAFGKQTVVDTFYTKKDSESPNRMSADFSIDCIEARVNNRMVTLCADGEPIFKELKPAKWEPYNASRGR